VNWRRLRDALVSPGRARRRDAASSVAPREHRSRGALRPCLALADRIRIDEAHPEAASWLDDLDRELAAGGISARRARRIRLELADHLACDPEAPLGTPAEVAERFAAELRGVETRRAVLTAFAALSLAAVLLAVAGIAGPRRYPDTRGVRGTIDAVSGLALLAFAQVAFVAGCLALWRVLRRDGVADLALAQRRAAVALVAGGGVSVALLVNAAVLRPMPPAWVALMVLAGALPLPCLALGGLRVRAAGALTPVTGARTGLADDLPHAVSGHGPVLLATLAAGAVGLIVAQGIVVEGSVMEGIVRGAIEAGGLFLGVVLLGRLLGLRR
jgi:hypothetical protein